MVLCYTSPFISDIFRCDKSQDWATWVYLQFTTIELKSLNGPKTVAFTIVLSYIWARRFESYKTLIDFCWPKLPIVVNKFKEIHQRVRPYCPHFSLAYNIKVIENFFNRKCNFKSFIFIVKRVKRDREY